jgi:hypothetical protein
VWVKGPTSSDRNRLSCQIRRIKKSMGSAFARAVVWMTEQIELFGSLLDPFAELV